MSLGWLQFFEGNSDVVDPASEWSANLERDAVASAVDSALRRHLEP
jgi:hypothetical protein